MVNNIDAVKKRLVSSAVLATDGMLRVYTKDQVMNLVPRSDGTTTAEVIDNYDGEGTRVEVHLGRDAGPINSGTLMWARGAKMFSGGQYYKGKTSPWWYTSRDFHELCLAAKDMTVRGLISNFEGGGSSQIGTITAGSPWIDYPDSPSIGVEPNTGIQCADLCIPCR